MRTLQTLFPRLLELARHCQPKKLCSKSVGTKFSFNFCFSAQPRLPEEHQKLHFIGQNFEHSQTSSYRRRSFNTSQNYIIIILLKKTSPFPCLMKSFKKNPDMGRKKKLTLVVFYQLFYIGRSRKLARLRPGYGNAGKLLFCCGARLSNFSGCCCGPARALTRQSTPPPPPPPLQKDPVRLSKNLVGPFFPDYSSLKKKFYCWERSCCASLTQINFCRTLPLTDAKLSFSKLWLTWRKTFSPWNCRHFRVEYSPSPPFPGDDKLFPLSCGKVFPLRML